MTIHIVKWHRLRFQKCEIWQCGDIVVRREFETYGLWCVVYYGNQSVRVWKTAKAAKLAAEVKPIVIKSHIESRGYEEVFCFAEKPSIPEVSGQGGNILDTWVCPRCHSTTGVPLPRFSSCSHCYGTSTPYPSDKGQGGTHE
ncbi:MAG: hypothetical protein ACXV7H_08285 [Methylobacter sp.]